MRENTRSKGAGLRGALAAMVLTLGLAVANQVAGQTVREIGPEENFCRAANRLGPGEELVLRPGDYRGPCSIRAGGQPGRPVVLRAKDSAHPPRIVYSGRETNVISIRASHVVVRGLAIGPTQRNVDGVRIYGGRDITVADCRLTGLGGIAIVANHGDVHDLTVRGNEIRDTNATGIYVGCHDGRTCAMHDALIANNYVHGVRAPDRAIGYGIQVKLNSSAVIRANTVVDTKGPGIMVYGAEDAGQVLLVERNLVMGSRRSSGIVVGGGPVIARNNIAVGSRDAGIALEDYGRRRLLRNIAIVHNTVYENGQGGISVPSGTLRGITVANNAASAPHGAELPAGQVGLRLLGNVACASAPACFAEAEHSDFSPRAVLVGAGVVLPDQLAPAEDFFGSPRRASAPAVGAVEGSGGPVAPGVNGRRSGGPGVHRSGGPGIHRSGGLGVHRSGGPGSTGAVGGEFGAALSSRGR